MSIVKYNSLTPYAGTLNNWVDEFFGKSIGDFVGNDFIQQNPKVNIKETETSYTIDLAAPGLAKEDFKIEIQDKMLIISAVKENQAKEQGDKFLRKEFSYLQFNQKFTLPETIDKENISASYDAGVLSLILPKAAPKAASVKQITIG
ncbi:MAG: Hsp20/alpha crystallin family protein [Saprospiraceae bacterium]|nr:Hsp20/alpha crystallin family protein [Saprospiraceae bacterium]